MRRFARRPGSLLFTPSGGGPPPSGAWSTTDQSVNGGFNWAITGTGDSVATTAGGSAGKGTLRGATSRSVAGGGQWYFEMKVLVAASSSGDMEIGICNSATTLVPDWTLLGANSEAAYSDNGLIWRDGQGFVGVGAAYNVNDIISVYFDANGGIAYLFKNNAIQATVTGFATSACPFYGATTFHSGSVELRTHQADFTYTQSAGWLAWD